MSQTSEMSGASQQAKSFWSDFRKLSKLWPFLRPNKKFVIWAVALIPIVSLLQMALPLVIRRVIDDGIAARNMDAITSGAVVFMSLIVVEYATRSLQSITSATAIHRMIQELRTHLVDHILKLSARFHDRTLSGRLVTRATSDFDNLSESLNLGVLTSVIDMAVLIGSFTGLFILDWRLALATLGILPIVIVVVITFSKALKKSMLIARSKLSILNGFTQECLQSVTSIKLLNAESELKTRHREMTLLYRDKQMKSVMLDASMFAIIDGMASVTIGLLLYLAIVNFTDINSISAGVMVAFIQYIQQVFDPLKNLGNKVAMLQGAFTAIDRVFEVIDTDDMITGSVPAGKVKGSVEFKDVCFSYKQPGQDSEPVLKGVDFKLEQGDSLAIIGKTGSGKSTIIKLVTKLYDGYTGQILIDDRSLADLEPVSVRSQIAIVPQDIVIFEGSVSFNISLGLETVSPEDIRSAAETVGAQNFINRLPGGYDFHLSEGGTNLSHGQKQLITFARALARRPALVILDEATSSVDPESERLIQTGIEKMLAQQSVIVIAHRLSTIRHCTQIAVMDSGKISEIGSHDQLIAENGLYSQLLEGRSDM
ncbi:ABC transporter ATP-binding protein/permease [Oligoflexaceae bacterium]|nr:ABC transporter ATP-binding protein/permease [Oligoflexaceae bacterium]